MDDRSTGSGERLQFAGRATVIGVMAAIDMAAFGVLGGGIGALAPMVARRFERSDSVVVVSRGLVVAAGAAIGCVSAALPGVAAAWTAAVLGWWLLLLGLIDVRQYLLPRVLTVPLIAAGLAVTVAVEPDALPAHAIGAAGAFAMLAGVAALYRRCRGRDGLGGGDAKLFAASGAWLGWASLPLVLALASAAGLIAAMIRWRGRPPADARLPFGVCLGAAIWAVYLAR